MESDEDEVSPRVKLVLQHCTALMEHFDTVQIVVTSHSAEEGTGSITLGGGNVFARMASVREWLIRMDADTRYDAREERRRG